MIWFVSVMIACLAVKSGVSEPGLNTGAPRPQVLQVVPPFKGSRDSAQPHRKVCGSLTARIRSVFRGPLEEPAHCWHWQHSCAKSWKNCSQPSTKPPRAEVGWRRRPDTSFDGISVPPCCI